jgi:hypothetical protein
MKNDKIRRLPLQLQLELSVMPIGLARQDIEKPPSPQETSVYKTALAAKLEDVQIYADQIWI